MAIIDKSYFFGEIIIASINTKEVGDKLEAFISKYERKLIIDLLGYEFATEFLTGIEQPVIEQKWLDILNGIEFTDLNNKKQKWIGFKGSGSYPESPIANYVYFYWNKDRVSQTTILGEVSNLSENSSLQSAGPKMVRAWNEMINWLSVLVLFLNKNETDIYPTWQQRDRWDLCKRFSYVNEYF